MPVLLIQDLILYSFFLFSLTRWAHPIWVIEGHRVQQMDDCRRVHSIELQVAGQRFDFLSPLLPSFIYVIMFLPLPLPLLLLLPFPSLFFSASKRSSGRPTIPDGGITSEMSFASLAAAADSNLKQGESWTISSSFTVAFTGPSLTDPGYQNRLERW